MSDPLVRRCVRCDHKTRDAGPSGYCEPCFAEMSRKYPAPAFLDVDPRDVWWARQRRADRESVLLDRDARILESTGRARHQGIPERVESDYNGPSLAQHLTGPE